MPLKFGGESVSHVNCLRVSAEVVDSRGQQATGWGETPLSVTWAWPSGTLSYEARFEAMVAFCKHAAAYVEVARRWNLQAQPVAKLHHGSLPT